MRLWVLLLGISLLAACSTLRLPADAVKVTVSNIEVIEATLLEQVYRVTLRVQNRSERPLTLAGGSFDLEINDRDFGSGLISDRVEIAPFSDVQVTARMVSTLFGYVRLVEGLQAREGEALAYSIAGRLSTDDFIGLSFSESGEIGLPGSGRP